jgi:hypothetical protein
MIASSDKADRCNAAEKELTQACYLLQAGREYTARVRTMRALQELDGPQKIEMVL